VGAYLCLNHLPFDSYRIAWERIQILYLVLYYLALAAPFFCAGLVTGLLLAAHAQQSARLYAANLLGSAVGGLVPLAVLPLLGESTVLMIAALGLLASLAFRTAGVLLGESFRAGDGRAGEVTKLVLLLLACCGLVLVAHSPPPLFGLRLSPYKGLSLALLLPEAELRWQRWNAFSRVDRVASPAIRSAPGLSLTFDGEVPAQDGLFVDGDSLSAVVVKPADDPAQLAEFTAHLPAALAYLLRPDARALVLEPRGGLDLLLALGQGAASVTAVEANPLLVEAASDVYQHERLNVVLEEGRSYVRRSAGRYDVLHLALTDTYRPVSSGAYSLGERYDLTVEAFGDYLASLEPDGLLVLERWMQLPPSETLRVAATAVEALRRTGSDDPGMHLAVIRDWQVSLILVGKDALTAEDLLRIREFCRAHSLDLVALPGLAETEVNRYNVLDQPVYFREVRELLAEPERVYAAQGFDVRPATDDRPFFFHFFKWKQTRAVLQQVGRVWQPWGGSGYFVLIALLAVGLLASGTLILLPMVALRAKDAKASGLRRWALAYFGLLGLGFLFAEIPLMQRFILFLDQPIYAFTAVVSSVLLFSGFGSLAAPRLSLRWALSLLVLAILLYPVALPWLFNALLGTPLALRLAVTVMALAPLGFLMGIPFPSGLGLLAERAPSLIPWAWAVNGCTSVLASILAAMISLSAGFSWVLAASALAYAGALASHGWQVRRR
jgi:hypothetical protein